MAKKLEDFLKKDGSFKSKEERNKESEDKKQREIVSLLNNISNDYSLWDMRYWEKYKDRKEVSTWVSQIDQQVGKGCGHVGYCIRKLVGRGVSEETIVNAIMKNPHKSYVYRIAPCGLNREACPQLQSKGMYSECDCNKCQDGKETFIITLSYKMRENKEIRAKTSEEAKEILLKKEVKNIDYVKDSLKIEEIKFRYEKR